MGSVVLGMQKKPQLHDISWKSLPLWQIKKADKIIYQGWFQTVFYGGTQFFFAVGFFCLTPYYEV